MSGHVIRPDDRIEATDDPALARRHGLTHYDAERGQYVAPSAYRRIGAAEPIERPGEGKFFQQSEPEPEPEPEPIDEGSEQSSADGMDSSTSSESTEPSAKRGATARRSRARTTESH